MPQRLKLIVAYDGSAFAGWQSQAHGNTVQDELERAFRSIEHATVRVHGAGRTDAGVHALAQCAHADVTKVELTAERWRAALNALLPPRVRVLRCQPTTDAFHARFSATGKIYRYRIWNSAVLPPLEYGRAWHVSAPIDLVELNRASRLFTGQHDFAGFAANRGDRETSSTRTINSIKVGRRRECIVIEVDGDGFLYKMVRLIVGGVLDCAVGRRPRQELIDRLNGDWKKSARFAAPAEGLYLFRVRY